MTRQRLILAVLVLSQLLVWLDNTILSTANEVLADPGRGLGATLGELQWATGSYTLVFATVMFTAGALGDRFGHRRVLLAGMVVFGLASLWAARSGSPGELIAARAVMGFGSALIMPPTMAVLAWTFPGPERATAMGVFSASSGFGLAGGPLLAGLLLDHFAWGSVFLVNVPIVVLAVAGILAFVPDFRSPVRRPLDPAGLALSAGGLALLAYGLIRAGQAGSWSGPAVWAPVLGGAVLLTAFVLVELRLRHPSFDPRLLRGRVFAGGNAVLGLLFFAMSGAGFFGAFYLQGVRGYSPLQAGLVTLLAPVGVMAGAPLATRLVQRYSLAPVGVAGLSISALGFAIWALYSAHTPVPIMVLSSGLGGLGAGMVIAPVTTELLSALPLERMGAGSAVTNTARQTGSVLGIAALGTVVSLGYRHAVTPHLAGLPAPARHSAAISAENARHIAATAHAPALRHAADSAFLTAMHRGALTAAATTLAATVLLAVTLRRSRRADEPEQVPAEPTTSSV